MLCKDFLLKSDKKLAAFKLYAYLCPTTYGAQNHTLSYLSYIKSKGVKLSEISECGHFPMYSNPSMMWAELANFLNSIQN